MKLKKQLSKLKGKIITTVMPAVGSITPVIVVQDSLLKLHRLVDLNKVDFHPGRQYEELPSITFTPEVYATLLEAQVKFFVECDENPDPANLSVQGEQHNFGKLKWFTPKYQLDRIESLYEVKLCLVDKPKKVKYCQLSISALLELLDEGEWCLCQITGGKLSKKQAESLNVTLVQGQRFTFYEVQR
jgi:hypothetical protein